MNKMFRVLEIVWLTIGIAGIALFTYFIMLGDQSQALYFLVITAVAGLMYSVRKRQRKKEEKKNKN